MLNYPQIDADFKSIQNKLTPEEQVSVITARNNLKADGFILEARYAKLKALHKKYFPDSTIHN